MVANLQVLRAAAAMMVVLHHMRHLLEAQFPALQSVTVGAAGVDLFFVLSGVVITLSCTARPQSAGAFLRARLVRVVPLWWLALGVLVVMLFAGFAPLGVQPQDATATNLLRSMLFVPFERAHGAVMPLVGVGWTLNYEMFFYLVVALLLVLPGERSRAGVAGALAALVVAGLIWPQATVAAQFYTHPLLLEFVAGAGLAQLWLQAPALSERLWRNFGLGALGLGIAGLILQARVHPDDVLAAGRVIWWGLPALAVVAGAMALERGGWRADAAPLMTLGAASYALYLFHPFVLQVIARLAEVREMAGLHAMMVAAFALFLSQVLAILLHLRVERPLGQLLRRAPRHHAAMAH